MSQFLRTLPYTQDSYLYWDEKERSEVSEEMPQALSEEVEKIRNAVPLLAIIQKHQSKKKKPEYAACSFHRAPLAWKDGPKCTLGKDKSVLLSGIMPQPCANRAFDKKKMSKEELSQLFSFYRGVEVRPPHTYESSLIDFLPDYRNTIIEVPAPFLNESFTAQCILQKGIIESCGIEYRLVVMHHISQKDVNPCGLLIAAYKTDCPKDQRCLYIDTVSVRREYQQKNFSTLLLSYTVKLAQELGITQLSLVATTKGLIPYFQFGFRDSSIEESEWKKLSLEERIQNYHGHLVLDLNSQEAKKSMNEQLFRALIDNTDRLQPEDAQIVRYSILKRKSLEETLHEETERLSNLHL